MHETLTVPFEDQPHDHSGDAVTPLASHGVPYRYALVGFQGRTETTYGTSADALLGVIIPGYEPAVLSEDPERDRKLMASQAELRIRYAYGVAFDHAAQAAITAALPPAELQTLRRSLEYSPKPLTHHELEEWNAEVPLILLAPYYRRHQLAPPAGNVLWLDSYTPELLLQGLARCGHLHIREHYTGRPGDSTRISETPSPDQFLTTLVEHLDMVARILDTPHQEPHHRDSLVAIAQRALQWPDLIHHDPDGELRHLLAQVTTHHDVSSAIAQDLSEAFAQLRAAR